MSFEVEIAALRSDAKAWDQAAQDLSGPIDSIRPLTLNGADDVTGLGQRMGIDASYEKARSRMEQLMGQAVEYFGIIADALLAVAAEYERMEAEGVSRFEQQGRGPR
jgi:hypothetical protein